MNSDSGIRRRLFLAREAAKLTQGEVAKELGASRQSVSRWEQGHSSPTPEQMRELCVLYGVTPSYLLFGKDLSQMFGQLRRIGVTTNGKPEQAAS